MKKTPKRFDNRQNYKIKKISDFPVHESDGSEIYLVEVNGALYQMAPVDPVSSSFSIEYVAELPETGALNTIYIVNKETVHIWNDVSATFVSLNVNISDLVNSLSSYFQIKNIKMSAVAASTWTASTQFAGYAYECSIEAAGVTANDIATVIFDCIEADSGNFARVNVTGSGTITIYSKTNTSITIPTIEIHKY